VVDVFLQKEDFGEETWGGEERKQRGVSTGEVKMARTALLTSTTCEEHNELEDSPGQ
jgi:hypothetical protein